MFFRIRPSITIACLLCLLSAAVLAAQTAPNETMRGIFGALITLLPASLDSDRFADPANREEITEALQRLVSGAAFLEQHGLGLNSSYDEVKKTLGEDAHDALAAFSAGELHSARFIVRNITEDCFACHSRLPGADRADLADRFAAAIDLEAIPPEERVRLLAATRQFEAALQAAEQLMNDDTLPATALDGAGVLEDYLKISVRVARDLDRPAIALRAFQTRSDLPIYLDLQVEEWIGALSEVSAVGDSEPLATGRQLLEEARRRNLYLQDRRGMVHALAASARLHLYVQSNPGSPESLAEAYYLLGLAESTISRTMWVPETEFFLEMAIRAAPDTDAARDAYAFLEEYVIANYTGSAGTNVPPDLWDRLIELRAMVER